MRARDTSRACWKDADLFYVSYCGQIVGGVMLQILELSIDLFASFPNIVPPALWQTRFLILSNTGMLPRKATMAFKQGWL